MAVVAFPRGGPARLAASPPAAGADRSFVTTPEGRRIAYVQAGRGPDAVLIHGTLMTLDDMRLGPMDEVAASFRAIAVDRPGHGWSDGRRGVDASLWSQAATVRSAVRSLGLERPVVCGHSFGGAVALAYGMAYPDEVAGVVALAPICFPEPRPEQALFGARSWPAWGDLMAEALGATLDPVLLPALWRAMFLPQAMPARFAEGFPFARAGRPEQTVAEGENAAAFWPDLARSALGYSGCRVPVRVVAGTADLVVNPFVHGIPASLLIPGARFELLPGVGHMLHHAAPGAVASAMRAVLAEGLPGRAAGPASEDPSRRR